MPFSFRYKVYIEYDGSFFHGWQRQKNLVTVQASIEDALEAIMGYKPLVEGAGRTDTGVHATGQVGHFDLNKQYSSFRLKDALNAHLRDKGVVILKLQEADPDFHARFSALSRTYHYHIVNRRTPLALDRLRAWHVILNLDVQAMQQAANHLIGSHDFSSFRSADCQSNSALKTLTQFDIKQEGERIIATIKARSFLHNQVRIMMGTLKRIGEGKWSPADLLRILEAKDRTIAGPTAPPHGLYLIDVGYE
ncbi:MAG: tRNA pseudouridine(38-40) synthase TruA [Alphaproteobacteria bacterium]|nr:tRNA pseudouridine(38-40) synthase TruA [Alphaproteobacteria bacterium]